MCGVTLFSISISQTRNTQITYRQNESTIFVLLISALFQIPSIFLLCLWKTSTKHRRNESVPTVRATRFTKQMVRKSSIGISSPRSQADLCTGPKGKRVEIRKGKKLNINRYKRLLTKRLLEKDLFLRVTNLLLCGNQSKGRAGSPLFDLFLRDSYFPIHIKRIYIFGSEHLIYTHWLTFPLGLVLQLLLTFLALTFLAGRKTRRSLQSLRHTQFTSRVHLYLILASLIH